MTYEDPNFSGAVRHVYVARIEDEPNIENSTLVS